MPISWNEIRDRAMRFSAEFKHETSEDAEAKTFWDRFFDIFGVIRRRLASFESPVKKQDGRGGYIDLLWKGVLLVEHKSRGKDLDSAYRQALDYFPNLKERDLPRYVVVSDFARFRLYDLEEESTHDFALKDLHKNIKIFGFIAGYRTQKVKPEDPANIKAAELMGRLHDQLKASGYSGHCLELYLVRLLFCLFAEDTSIFEKRQFQDYLELRTAEDGHDLGAHLGMIFHVLNTDILQRQKKLDEHLAAFPYVNGKLFAEPLPPASFDAGMRSALLDCCALDWSRISPAIFGSLFQSVMDAKARRNLGAHYTRETNILRLIKPLFLDALREEFNACKGNRQKLLALQQMLARLRFLDPACGCGNFLVITYRELRLLELEILRALHKSGQMHLDISAIVFLNVDQFYGIEREEFPAQIAQVAMWLTDHQMNMLVSEEFGHYFRRLPLTKSATIVHGNALTLDWRAIIAPADLSYILGNPPFVGKKEQSEEQKAEVMQVFSDVKGAGILDYVSAWYRKAADYMSQNKKVTAAFVSTNSISQGEQVGVLWPGLYARGLKIHYAHRTFQWSSEARGKAAVHCVIIGFALREPDKRVLYEYETPKAEPQALAVARINPYLVDAPDLFLAKRSTPICSVPAMNYGSMANDGGHLLLDASQREELLTQSPSAAKYIRRFMGGDEFINNESRWCLWLVDAKPEEMRGMPGISERIAAVRKYRTASGRAMTVKLADTPMLFGEIRQPDTQYLLVPKVSSENRRYMPIGFCTPEIIASGSCLIVPQATMCEFGILSSAAHMTWMRATCGRMKSDYQYSVGIVYNNFPWPMSTDKQRAAIEAAARGVLDARAKFPDSSLADLYDPVSMPPELTTAHQELDRAVDTAYGKTTFVNELARIALLFELYQKIHDPLLVIPKRTRGGRRI
ncbi:MAG TPA: class I SAM-dependent DNA methyltransferase [bacterium]|nr:class I SAM-dependent DNA methyltransferase [bacterium]